MKNLLTTKVLQTCVFFSALLVSMVCFAQSKDPKAKEVLDQMSEKYKNIGAFKASFTVTIQRANKSKDTMEGKITVKGNKYRFKIDNQEMFNNEKKTWTYLADENGVYEADYDPSGDEIRPTQIPDLYKKGYNYLYNEELSTASTHVIDLQPESRSESIFKIRITIEKSTKLVKSWQLFYKEGDTHTYTLDAFNFNINVTDKYFEFDPSQYPGVKKY